MDISLNPYWQIFQKSFWRFRAVTLGVIWKISWVMTRFRKLFFSWEGTHEIKLEKVFQKCSSLMTRNLKIWKKVFGNIVQDFAIWVKPAWVWPFLQSKLGQINSMISVEKSVKITFTFIVTYFFRNSQSSKPTTGSWKYTECSISNSW